ncbi:NAD(P)-binding domain-containing protein [Streptomyces sp. NPDC001219]
MADNTSSDTLSVAVLGTGIMGAVGAEGPAALARFADAHRLRFVDAPVLGTKAPAEKGELTVLSTEAAREAGVRMDLVAAGAERLRRAEEQGHGQEDAVAAYFASFGGADG